MREGIDASRTGSIPVLPVTTQRCEDTKSVPPQAWTCFSPPRSSTPPCALTSCAGSICPSNDLYYKSQGLLRPSTRTNAAPRQCAVTRGCCFGPTEPLCGP